MTTSGDQYSSLYWTSRAESLPPNVKEIISSRGGHPVRIESADTFFEMLADTVESLEDMSETMPLNEDLARARVKAFVANPIHRPKLHDLVEHETRSVVKRMGEIFTNVEQLVMLPPIDLLNLIERETSVLRTIVATGCYFDDGSQADLWKKCIEMLLPRRSGYITDEGVELYPALLVFYTVGISAQLKGCDETTKVLLSDTVWQHLADRHHDISVATILYPGNVLDQHLSRQPGYRTNWIPSISYLFIGNNPHDTIWKEAQRYAPSEISLERAIDSFEYLLGSTYAFEPSTNPAFCPLGIAVFRRASYDLPPHAEHYTEMAKRHQSGGSVWPLVQAGMFDGSIESCVQALEKYNEIILHKRRRLI